MYAQLSVVVLAIVGLIQSIMCEGQQEFCVRGDDFQAQCSDNEAVMVTHALYGRMRIGKCVKSDYGQLGCQNDVLFIADKLCSGKKSCVIDAGGDDLLEANVACAEDLSSYLEIDYQCVSVVSPSGHCGTTGSRDLTDPNKYISSQVAMATGCGSRRVPWVIRANPGQTIHLWLIDFGALQRQKTGMYSSCIETYGFILERHLGVNHTLCGSLERKGQIYSSKTNTIELQLVPLGSSQEYPPFLLQYKFVGCSDLTPPAEAWFKREGSEAVIGCKSNDRVWRLSCHGNTWDGVVGNCSMAASAQMKNTGLDFSFSSVIFLTGVVCAAFLLVIVVVVAGSVYIKKQSIKHEIKLRSDYSAATLSPSQYYATKSRCDTGGSLDTSSQPLVHVHDRTLPVAVHPHMMDTMRIQAHNNQQATRDLMH